MKEGKIKEAKEIFKLNIDLYPESPSVYYNLGEAYEKNNQLEKAIRNYEIAYKKGMETSSTRTEHFKKNLDRVLKLKN